MLAEVVQEMLPAVDAVCLDYDQYAVFVSENE